MPRWRTNTQNVSFSNSLSYGGFKIYLYQLQWVINKKSRSLACRRKKNEKENKIDRFVLGRPTLAKLNVRVWTRRRYEVNFNVTRSWFVTWSKSMLGRGVIVTRAIGLMIALFCIDNIFNKFLAITLYNLHYKLQIWLQLLNTIFDRCKPYSDRELKL